MEKSLDRKLARILRDRSCNEFILADAKDADMATGMAAPGRSPESQAPKGRFRSLDEYRQRIRENVRQGLVDIMLMSAANNEVLTLGERLFDSIAVTPAVRANDSSDVWLPEGGVYHRGASMPFRSASIDQAMCGKPRLDPGEPVRGADLGLYSVTFNNDLAADHRVLDAYRLFRQEAAAKGFRHFLEVFDPNAPQSPIPDVARFVNDMIARSLAGAAGRERPLFLKVAYHGPAAMEQLAGYDSRVIVGILGGASGTTMDAFHQLWEAKRYGARVALYGRMINNAEHQLTFIAHLRMLADDDLEPAEAVRSYHAALRRLGIRPCRDLDKDLQKTARASAYGGTPPTSAARNPVVGRRPLPNDLPDFSKMTLSEKLAWNQARWKRIFDSRPSEG
jgi:hypothetical protein